MYLSLHEVLRPGRLEDCLEALADDAAVLAGGTHLNTVCPGHLSRLVDLQSLPLRGLDRSEGRLVLGALVRLADLVERELDAGHAALAQAAAAERNLPIRNQSTVGGRICRQRADGRLSTALLALNARVEVARAEADPVRLPLADLNPSAAIVTAVAVPTARLSAYTPFSQTAVDAPVTDAAVARGADGTWRIASGGHGPDASGVVSLKAAAALLDGAGDGPLPEGWRAALRAAVIAELPAYTDARAGGDYRRAVAATLIVRTVQGLWPVGEES